MIYLYERNKTGICVNRVFGYDRIVEIPDTLNGFPVTELGAYIFSDHIEVSELNKKKETGTYCTENGTEETPADDMPQAAGNQVEEICLPRFLRKIGRYAFYNCFELEKISFGSSLKDLGAGALTGCHRVHYIEAELNESGESCLREVLTELPETLLVEIIGAGEKGRFWFPEFFEEGVENTPARILENHVHGSGIRYRNSFLHKTLNILEYDKLFPYAVAWEQEDVVLKLALDRILYPVGLTEAAEKQYHEYLKEHGEKTFLYLGKSGKYHELTEIIRILKPERELLEKILEKAQNVGDSRWVSILMNELAGKVRKKRKAFEL